MKISTTNAFRLITRFENAVREHAFISTIESGEAAAAYAKAQRDYELARKALRTFCIEAIIEAGS